MHQEPKLAKVSQEIGCSEHHQSKQKQHLQLDSDRESSKQNVHET